VEVLAAVSPAAHVHATDVGDRAHRSLDPRQQRAQLGCEVVGQVARFGVVRARLQEQDHRQPGWVVGRAETPPV
jgi:hypothetical protein